MVGDNVEGSAKSEHPLDAKTWSKYAKKMPQGRFDDKLSEEIREMIDKYGEETVDEYMDDVLRLWPEITYLPKFVEKVGDQLEMDYLDARRKGKPFGKQQKQYRMTW